MALLTKVEILAADDRPTLDVEMPEWGGTVRVCSISGAEREKMEHVFGSIGKGKAKIGTLRAQFLQACLVGEDKKPLFTEAEIDALAGKSSAAIMRVFEKAWGFNGLTDKDVDELAGN